MKEMNPDGCQHTDVFYFIEYSHRHNHMSYFVYKHSMLWTIDKFIHFVLLHDVT